MKQVQGKDVVERKSHKWHVEAYKGGLYKITASLATFGCF